MCPSFGVVVALVTQPFAGPPAVVAEWLGALGCAPELLRARLVPLLLGGPTEPEQLSCRQGGGQCCALGLIQPALRLAPVPLEQGFAGLAPLQLPAGGIVRPALEHGRWIDLTGFRKAGLHGGAVLERRRQLLQHGHGSGGRRLRQEPGGLQPFRASALGEAQQSCFGLGLLGAAPPQQPLGEAQLQFGRRGGLSQAAQGLLAATQLHQA